MIASQEKLIEALNGRLESEKQSTKLALELADSYKRQANYLTDANNSLKEAITAKDSIILNNSKQIEILQKRKTKLSTIFKALGVGIGIGLILK